MSKKQSKSSKSTQKSFPEESEAASGYDPKVARRQRQRRDKDSRLVCHRHYDAAHSRDFETLDDIELLSPKQNGSTVDTSSHESPKAQNKASIKGMWKKAFKSLKTDSKGSSKEKEEKIDRQESKYSRMSRQSSLKHLLRRSDSGDSQPSVPREARHFAGPHSYHEESQTFDKYNNRLAVEQGRRSKSQEIRTRKTSTEKHRNTSLNSPPKSPRPSTRIDLLRRTASEPKYKHDYDSTGNDSPKSSRQTSLRKFLRRSESKEIKEKEGYAHQDSNDKSSRQSSLKRIMRKDSKEKDQPSTPSDSELGTCVEEPGEMDPVFATLRAASGLRRPNRGYSETESELDHQNDPELEHDLDYNPEDYDYYDDHSAQPSYNMPQSSNSSRDFPR